MSAPAAIITVRETLALLEGAFAETAIAVADGRYVLWLGSGVSFNRMPALNGLIKNVLEALRNRIDRLNPNCPFRKALTDVLALATPGTNERRSIDYSVTVDTWKDIDPLINRLAAQYSQVLDHAPEGEEDDYLLWNALDVVGIYADPAITPDSEHLCIAALIMEGAVTDLATANWDGLVENAVNELSGGADLLRVCVLPEDSQQPARQATIYKFHGCAVSARTDPARYRKKIVGRKSQISGWHQKSENKVMAAKLVDLATTRPTLMLGLSAQDHNIQETFVAAQQTMNWPWPSHPPAYVFSENSLGADQRALLRNVYHADYTPAIAPKMVQSALLQAYAKPLLMALWLYVLGAKARFLIETASSPGLTPADRKELVDGLIALRNHCAGACPSANRDVFIRSAFQLVRRVLVFFREGKEADAAIPGYQAVSPNSLSRMADDPALATTGLPELAVAISILGTVQERGEWALTAITGKAGLPSALRLNTTVGTWADIFFVANAQSALVLFNEGHAPDDQDIIVVHSHEIGAPMPRSPKPLRGRTGRIGRREVSVRALLNSAGSADELISLFRGQVGL